MSGLDTKKEYNSLVNKNIFYNIFIKIGKSLRNEKLQIST